MERRRTRGPRTPDEKASDAARTAATAFEKLPSSWLADETLKPLAAFLRLTTAEHGDVFPEGGGEYLSLRELRAYEKVQRDFLDALERWRELIDLAPYERVVEVEAMLDAQRRQLRQIKERIAAQAA